MSHSESGVALKKVTQDAMKNEEKGAPASETKEDHGPCCLAIPEPTQTESPPQQVKWR